MRLDGEISDEEEKQMTTVKSSKTGRKYEVESKLYGTSNTVYRLSFGGIFLSLTGNKGLNAGYNTMDDAIAEADDLCERWGIEVTE